LKKVHPVKRIELLHSTACLSSRYIQQVGVLFRLNLTDIPCIHLEHFDIKDTEAGALQSGRNLGQAALIIKIIRMHMSGICGDDGSAIGLKHSARFTEGLYHVEITYGFGKYHYIKIARAEGQEASIGLNDIL